MFGPFYGKNGERFITKVPKENTMGSIADRFRNVAEQTFRAAIGSQEALLELHDAVTAFLIEIDALLPAELLPVEEVAWVATRDAKGRFTAKVPPVAETEWMPVLSEKTEPPVRLSEG